MRTRILLGGVAVALVTLLGPARVAYAQETQTEPAGEAEEECIQLLEDGGKIDDCQEAPSPILPATNELFWGTVSFVVLFVLLWKLALPPIRKAMVDRTERIKSSVDAADHAKAEAQGLLDEYRQQLDQARSESGRIIEEARQTADALRRDLQARAETEIGEIRRRSAADIEAAKAQAVADHRSEVTELAIAAAEIVVQRNLDRDTNAALVENFIRQVGAAADAH